MNAQKNNALYSALLLLLCTAFGVVLALHRDVGGDELYSLVASIDRRSYKEILLSPFFFAPTEGNNSPLFYLMQKIWIGLISYTTPPAALLDAHGAIQDNQAKILLRLPWNIAVSCGVVAIFSYSARKQSWKSGLLALLVLCGSPILFWIWAEMRPYALWFALSTLHTISLQTILQGETSPRARKTLFATQWLLSLLIFLAVIQIFLALAASLAAGVRWTKREIFLGFALPLLVALAYYFPVTHGYPFHLENPWNTILGSFPKSRLLFLAFATALSLAGTPGWKKLRAYCLYASGAFGAGLAMLAMVYAKTNPANPGFVFPSRYFLFLLPISACVVLGLMTSLREHARWKAIYYVGIFLVFYQAARAAPEIWALMR